LRQRFFANRKDFPSLEQSDNIHPRRIDVRTFSPLEKLRAWFRVWRRRTKRKAFSATRAATRPFQGNDFPRGLFRKVLVGDLP